MQLLTEYIQPVTDWLQTNPQWALVITFFISFAESLAIIGSIVPGSITMTAIGILAGSGIMRIDLTFVAATLGAIAGDGISYLLGYFFSDRLVNMWPFSRNPQWLAYGKEYFVNHGGKSVLIGRFIGPLRSIIPVIAGMMRMSHWRFFVANFISAIFWSMLYVLPGVLIGAASHELPPDIAAQLLIIVLGILIGIWLATLIIKWSLLKLNHFLNATFNEVWRRARNQRYLATLFKRITPRNEKNHYGTVGLLVCFLSTLLLLLSMIAFLLLLPNGVVSFNRAIHLAVESLRNEALDSIFIGITQVASFLPLVLIASLTIGLLIYFRKTQLLIYYIGLLLSTGLLLQLLHQIIVWPYPTGIVEIQTGSSFPSCSLTYATVLFSSLLLYFNKIVRFKFISSINITFILLLLLIGFGQMLIGEYWLTDILGAYLLGLLLSLSFWLFYRQDFKPIAATTALAIAYFSIILVGTLIAIQFNYENSYKNHQLLITQHLFTTKQWWKQKKPLLPLYRRDRFGHPVALFNLQYAGSLEHLSERLATSGWILRDESFYQFLLKHLTAYPDYREIPLISQLYLNRKPQLIMIYKLNQQGDLFILRLWRSNYYLYDQQQRIWLGSVHVPKGANNQNSLSAKSMAPLNYIKNALPQSQFLQRTLPIQIPKKLNLPVKVAPNLLLIQEFANTV